MKKLLLIFLYAFVLNWIWENAHSYFYFLPSGEPITQYRLLRATLFDAVFIAFFGILFMKVAYLRERKWYALIGGFIAAIVIEKYALATGRWAYNDLMPVIPLLNTGLTPTVQFGVLSYFIFSVVGKGGEGRRLHRCQECGFHYEDRGWKEKCEVWCREHHSCNLEITAHAEEGMSPT